MGEGIAGGWEVAEDGYEEQIVIPNEKRELAAGEGIEIVPAGRDTRDAEGIREN